MRGCGNGAALGLFIILFYLCLALLKKTQRWGSIYLSESVLPKFIPAWRNGSAVRC